MRLFSSDPCCGGIGVQVSDERCLDVRAAVDALRRPPVGSSMLELVASPRGLDEVRRLVDDIGDRDGPWVLPTDAVALSAPIPRPGKILGVALNYRDFCERGRVPLPTRPKVFAKFATTVVGPGQPVLVPDGLQVTYEGELAVVIGRTVRDVRAKDALKAVAGYTVFNDLTASTYVREDVQLLRGKNLDTFGPMGPYLVTADEVPNPDDLAISTVVNGVERQRSRTSQMVFGVAELVEFFATFCTLEPGDVIATGTPAGTAAQHTPPAFVQAGDTVSVSVQAVGTLINPIVAA